MRPQSLMLPAALLLAASASTQAQNQPVSNPDAISQVQVNAPAQPYRFWGYEAEAVTGAYAMSNGWRIKVDPGDDGIVAQIGKKRPMTLVALSRDKFASRDGNVIMEFNKGAYGDEMVMSYVPDVRTAQRVVLTSTTTLAQR